MVWVPFTLVQTGVPETVTPAGAELESEKLGLELPNV
jgi:hypothetical protein